MNIINENVRNASILGKLLKDPLIYILKFIVFDFINNLRDWFNHLAISSHARKNRL